MRAPIRLLVLKRSYLRVEALASNSRTVRLLGHGLDACIAQSSSAAAAAFAAILAA